jgi:hypothetical protein
LLLSEGGNGKWDHERFELGHLSHDVLHGGRSIETVRVPQIDKVYAQAFQALLARDGHIGRVSAKREATAGLLDATKLSGNEDVVSLASPSQPVANERLTVPL